MKSKILIYRIGSMGDTLVSLPALNLIKNKFPSADRILLTNLPIDGGIKAVTSTSLLSGTELVQDYINYTIKTGDWREYIDLLKKIRTIAPNYLIYLMPKRSKTQLMRDWIFFRLCGIRNIIGLNFAAEYQQQQRQDSFLYESEAARLVRNLTVLGCLDLKDPQNWRLQLAQSDFAEAKKYVPHKADKRYIVACVGTKAEVKDWGNDNWALLLRRISSKLNDITIIFIGSSDEMETSDRLAEAWEGPSINLCGLCSPRVSAAILSGSRLFIGHDSGPMHMASAVETPIVAIFSAHNKPGVWFPAFGKSVVFYKQTDCYDCGLTNGCPNQKKCIRSVTVDEVEQGFWQLYEQQA